MWSCRLLSQWNMYIKQINENSIGPYHPFNTKFSISTVDSNELPILKVYTMQIIL